VGDPMEPRPGRGAAFKAIEAEPGPEQGLLHSVFGFEGPDHATTEDRQPGPMMLEAVLQCDSWPGAWNPSCPPVGHSTLVTTALQ
jgi:hypothetical protein